MFIESLPATVPTQTRASSPVLQQCDGGDAATHTECSQPEKIDTGLSSLHARLESLCMPPRCIPTRATPGSRLHFRSMTHVRTLASYIQVVRHYYYTSLLPQPFPPGLLITEDMPSSSLATSMLLPNTVISMTKLRVSSGSPIPLIQRISFRRKASPL